MKRTLSALVAAIALLATPAIAGPGPSADSPAPVSALTGQDQTGAERTFANLTGTSGLVVYFVRSADWCPFCQKQLVELNAEIDAFYAAGYAVVAVSTDSVEELAAFAGAREIGFVLLSDEDSSVISAFDVLDPAYPDGHRFHGLPFPATFVLDADGTVTDALYEADAYGQSNGYRERLTAADVKAAVLN